MDKIERVINSLRGEDVDRPPFSFWYHFGLQHLRGSENAKAEIEFYRSYELDGHDWKRGTVHRHDIQSLDYRPANGSLERIAYRTAPIS